MPRFLFSKHFFNFFFLIDLNYDVIRSSYRYGNFSRISYNKMFMVSDICFKYLKTFSTSYLKDQPLLLEIRWNIVGKIYNTKNIFYNYSWVSVMTEKVPRNRQRFLYRCSIPILSPKNYIIKKRKPLSTTTIMSLVFTFICFNTFWSFCLKALVPENLIKDL